MAKLGKPRTAQWHERDCPQCSKRYEVPEWKLNRGTGLFCSGKCYHEFRRGKSGYGRKKIEPIFKICPACKKSFATGGRGRKRYEQIYCTTMCAGAGERGYANGEMNPMERAWLAGVIDGEGSIIKHPGRITTYGIVVYNTCYPFIQKCKDLTGVGSIIEIKPRQAHHKLAFQWKIYGENVRIVLKQIFPWLIIKLDKAKEAIGVSESVA